MKCTIENHDGRLRLRWLYQGKRYTMGCGVSDNPTGRAVAKSKAAHLSPVQFEEDYWRTLNHPMAA